MARRNRAVTKRRARTAEKPPRTSASYQLLFEKSPQPMWVYDPKSLYFLAVNEAAVERYGYSREEFLRMTLKDVRPPEDLPALLESYSKPIQGDKKSTWRHRKKNGILIDVEITAHDFEWAGRPARIASAEDITERKRAERKLRQSEESYRLLFEQNPEPMWVFDTDTLAFVAVNQAAVKHYGYSREEFLRMTIKDIRPSEDVPALLADVVRAQGRGLDIAGAWRHRTKDGGLIDVQITSHDLEWEGHPARLVAVEDVTEAKRAEQKLRQSEASYRLLFENNPQPMWVYDPESAAFLAVNEAAVEHYGYSREEFLRMTLKDIRPAEDVPAFLKSLSSLGKGLGKFGRTHQKKDGSQIGVVVTSQEVDWDGHRARLSAIEDLTEQKRAEEKLRQSEASYRLLFEQNPQPMFVYDPDSLVFLAVNEAAVEHYGYSREEFLRMTLKDIRPAEDVPAFLESMARLGKGLRKVARTHRKKDGSLIGVVVTSQPADWEGHRARLAAIEDLTERKRAEEKLRQSEESYRLLFERNPQPMWVVDMESFAFLAVNQAAVEHYGYSREEFLRMTLRDIRPAEDLPAFEESLSHIVEGQPVKGTPRHRKKDGTLIDVEITADELRWAGHRAWLVALEDITERKRAEEKLRHAEESYRQLVERSPDAILVHRRGTIIFANGNAAELFGASSPEGLLGRQHLDSVHPEDREEVKQRMERFAGDLTSVRRIEHRFIGVDGRDIYAEIAARSVIYQGETATQVTFRDVSKRKKAEADLRQSEARLAAAQAIAHVGDWSWDILNDDLIWSAEMFQIYGVSPAEFDGKPASVLKLIHPEDKWLHERSIRDLLGGKAVDPFEYRIIRPDGEERVVQVLGGAMDRDPAGLPVRISGVVLDVTERKRAEERFYKAFHASPEPITIATASEGRYLDVNESFLRVSGYQREEVVGHTSLELRFWSRPEDRATLMAKLDQDGFVRDMEIEFRTKSGQQRTALDCAELVDIAGEKCVLAIFKDITEQRSLEKQLRQAQKMEAIGQLSGGIAHDFNNLLSVIIGYGDVMQEKLPAGDPLRKNCEEITKAGRSAASLTRQLLAFSRQQMLEPKVLDLNAVVRNVEKMLRRLIGEHIELTTALSPTLARVKADQGQMEQVIMNLAVNARDAMPNGGKLLIETADVDLSSDNAPRHTLQPPGRYVLLTFTDTGVGMTAETQARIFEPFFTTKEIGRGTGLGLATVYGVVKQSGGFIWVYSEVGHGTTFKIYLPPTTEAKSAQKAAGTAGPLGGSETVLLVEDEEALREFTASVLTQRGYNVLVAERPDKALEIARQHAGSIQLLLTDVIMPGMNGRELARKMNALRPDIRVVYTSGYTGFTHPDLVDSNVILLPKPFTRDELLQKVREGLELVAESKAR